METHPLISICVISYQRSGYLYRTLKCLREHTKYPNIELIVSDDGSEDTDKITEVCKLNQVDNLLLNPHKGFGDNCNTGMKAANGEYILFVEGDWELLPHCGDYIQECLAAFGRHETLGMIRLQHWRDTDIDRIFTTDKLPILTLKPAGMIYVYTSSPHIKRKSFHEEVGYFEEGRSAGDCETILAERFNKQKKIKIGFLKKVFKHIGHFSVGKCASGSVWDPNHTPNIIPMDFDAEEFRKLGLL